MDSLQQTIKIIQRVLKYDRKTNNYKIALIRALKDIALTYAGIQGKGAGVAVPLNLIANLWIGYYWPFMDEEKPVYQGGFRTGTADVAFRRELTKLKSLWKETELGSHRPSDGIVLTSEIVNGGLNLREETLRTYSRCSKILIQAIQQPIRYAGDSNLQFQVFSKCQKGTELHSSTVLLPHPTSRDIFTVVSDEMWESFKFYSLYIEAFCLHEWSLFVENADLNGSNADRGQVYSALTDRPDSRRPLQWERNQFELMMMEGQDIRCFWTNKPLDQENYDVDHIIPVTTFPINELWNLVPSDSAFNRWTKRDRMPDPSWHETMSFRLPDLYQTYFDRPVLRSVLQRGVSYRFGLQKINNAQDLTHEALKLIFAIAESRNTPTFNKPV